MSDDVVYALILIGSVLLGFVVRLGVTSSTWRRRMTTLVGVSLVVWLCDWNGLHSAIMAFTTAAIIRFTSYRKCHVISFVWCFGYLAFFQSAYRLGFSPINGHTNALQILMVLKLVGVAFEVHDSMLRRRELMEQKEPEDYTRHLAIKYRNVDPSFWDIICYSYCFIGLFTGPYFTFRTYSDLIHGGNVCRKLNAINYVRVRYMWTILVCGVVYLLLNQFFSFSYARSDEFYQNEPLWYHVFYAVPLFALFRIRLYLAFIIAECACITSGLGGYPAATKPLVCQGPSDLETLDACNDVIYDFTTIHSIDVVDCELAPTIQHSIKTWNKTIQYWLSANVHRRLPLKSASLKVTITMLVSAYWHGLHPGYYLTFLSTSVYLYVEYQLLSYLLPAAGTTHDHTNNEVKVRRQLTGYSFWMAWFIRMRASEYLGLGFEMKDFEATIRYWRHLYFGGHVLLALAFALCIGWTRHKQQRRLVKL